MKVVTYLPTAPFSSADSESARMFARKLTLTHILVTMVALIATLASLGIAIHVGWQAGGPWIERLLRIVIIVVAVLFAHWLPLGWPTLRGLARSAAGALWLIAIAVVLYGQTAFFMMTQQHAGDRRAATVATPLEPTTTSPLAGRSRTEIARDIAKVRADLARVQAVHCVGDCPTLKIRQASLAAKLTALEVETEEALRRQATEDRRFAQADRLDQQRQRLRADPVALPVAAWLGATTHLLELIIGLAHAVVLEGAAVLGWMLVAVATGRTVSLPNQAQASSDQAFSVDATANCRQSPRPVNDEHALDQGSTAGNHKAQVLTQDELSLQKIHEAVTSGQIKPTQAAIRTLLSCGQPKAGELNRRYRIHYGTQKRPEDDAHSSGRVMPAVTDG